MEAGICILQSFFPMFKLGNPCIILSAQLFIRQSLRIGHVLDQIIQQVFFALVHLLSIRIAPFAVILVKEAIRFLADHSVLIQRHPAALTV